MELYEILLVAAGLSMDAFAVSVTNGMCVKRAGLPLSLMCGLCFGLFQGAMPAIGYALGKGFESRISAFDHWIALILLGFIGGRMIADTLKTDETEESLTKLTFPLLLVQGFATSVDALAVGVGFAALSVSIVVASALICAVTFIISCTGVYIGKSFGCRLNKKAETAGGIILIGIGLKVFIEHMFF
ncbi:manganese efflux pump MntP family protein [Ruminococcus sp. Marseille-P6503]|uniref:manganese efflux pump MntP n=1 Tax=Ruminococcus sp. Marseille-P6503 TaxID=2364796 RepID=UPI000F53C8AA|nr:manganese efflux pump MntP family protein [Ruminococcus sp. Marseille-P6503]